MGESGLKMAQNFAIHNPLFAISTIGKFSLLAAKHYPLSMKYFPPSENQFPPSGIPSPPSGNIFPPSGRHFPLSENFSRKSAIPFPTLGNNMHNFNKIRNMEHLTRMVMIIRINANLSCSSRSSMSSTCLSLLMNNFREGGDPILSDGSQCAFIALDTVSPYVANYEGKYGGVKAHYMLRWVTTRGGKGPWSEIVSSTIAGNTVQRINHGGNCAAVTANAPTGYRFVKWTSGGTDFSTANPLTITNVIEDMTIMSNFTSSLKTDARNWNLYE